MTQSETMKAIISNIERLRQERDLTVTELAKRAGMHQPHMTRLLHGGRCPTVPLLIRIAGALGVSLSEICDDRVSSTAA